MSPIRKTLSWANWPYYIDRDEAGAYPTIDMFEQLTDWVTYEEAIPTNEEFYAKVKDGLLLGQDIGYDLVLSASLLRSAHDLPGPDAAHWLGRHA